jgi:hypothetical protein
MQQYPSHQAIWGREQHMSGWWWKKSCRPQPNFHIGLIQML